MTRLVYYSANMVSVVGVLGPTGIEIQYQQLQQRCSINKINLHDTFKQFIVREKRLPGQPKNKVFSPRTEYAYRLEQVNGITVLYVPWLIAHKLLVNGIITKIRAGNLLSGLHMLDQCELVEPLYEYQLSIVDSLCCDHFARPSDLTARAYLKLGTGLGKTRIAIAIALRLRVPTLIIVPTKAIRTQWAEEIATVAPSLKVVLYDNAKHTDTTDAAIVIGIVNTFRNKDPNDYSNYGLTILDEAHELHSAKNSMILWNAQTPYVLGLSATPLERLDGMDKLVCLHIGPPIDATELVGSENSASARGLAAAVYSGHVREIKYNGHPDFIEPVHNSDGGLSAIGTMGSIVKDPHRLAMLVEEIDYIYNMHTLLHNPAEYGLGPHPTTGEIRRHGIFVFAEHRDILPIIKNALTTHFAENVDILSPELDDDADVVVVPDMSVLRGGVSNAELSSAKSSPIVLTTYGYSRRGISLVNMTAIVFASPRRNGMNQILGRITRSGSDSSIVRIISDIVDVDTPMRAQFSQRMAVYKEKGFTHEMLKRSYVDYNIAANGA